MRDGADDAFKEPQGGGSVLHPDFIGEGKPGADPPEL
jgi:hypothetical protein